MGKKKPCMWCNNHKVDADLDWDNDYSAKCIGSMPRYTRLMLCSGAMSPVRVEYETWNDTYGKWNTAGVYYPKYCPECGRKITEVFK